MEQQHTTIAAISTPLAMGAIGIVRLSGSRAKEIVSQIFVPVGHRNLFNVPGFSAIYGKVVVEGEELDEVVVYVYTAPRSYTGEDVVEISCHGGTFLLTRVLRAVLDRGAQAASAGEFTKRAFLNGKMQLTQAEAVMDLISANGVQAGRAAMAARDGVLSRRIEGICADLTGLAAHMSAWVDYPDEEIEELQDSRLLETLTGAEIALKDLLSTFDAGKLLREGVSTAIVGRPNVGKSTLMNLLAGTQRSIVTDIPGTTRDIVEETVRLGEDILLCIADTAGLRSTDDPVEAIGVELAGRRMDTSGLVLAVFDGSAPLTAEDLTLAEKLRGRPAVAIVNKSDLGLQDIPAVLRDCFAQVVPLSARTGDGTEALTHAVAQVLHLNHLDASAPMLANERQRSCALRAQGAVSEALAALCGGMTMDAVNICIDEALEALLELDGKRVTDAVVEEVFANFCVGK